MENGEYQVVGKIPYQYEFKVSQNEIQELIEMPLSALMNDSNYWKETFTVEGVTGKASFFKYKGKVIWGATARMLKQTTRKVE